MQMVVWLVAAVLVFPGSTGGFTWHEFQAAVLAAVCLEVGRAALTRLWRALERHLRDRREAAADRLRRAAHAISHLLV